jgi:tetratricopeptide (TPR) repeat protein
LGIDKSTVIQNAQKYTAKGQIEKAIEEWQKLIAETPNDGNIYNTIGDLYLKNNSSKEAIEAYLRAADAYNKAGFALKTIAVYKKIIKINPQHMEAYVKLADLHAERGLTGNAIEDYMKVAKHYVKEGKVRESLEIYRKIANLDPTNVNIQLKLAELCLKEGLKTEALDGLLKSAQSCSAQGKTQEAETLYARILQIDPKHEAARSQVKESSRPAPSPHSPAQVVETTSSSQSKSQKNEESQERSLREALNRPEATAAQRQQLGYLLLKKGDLEGALQEFQQLVQEYHQDQLWGPAIQVMQDYLQKDPKRIEAHDLLAQSYEKSGVVDRAIEEYVTVIDLMIREEHSMTEAMELFNRIRQLDPQNPVVEKLKVRFLPYLEPAAKPSVSEVEPSITSKSEKSESVSKTGGTVGGSGGKESVQSYLTEAEVYLKYGLSGKALEQLYTAVKIAPDHPDVHLRLKEVYKIEGRISETVQECLELARIYTQTRQSNHRLQILKEALELDPGNAQVKSLLDPGAGPADRSVSQAREAAYGETSKPQKSMSEQISLSPAAQSMSQGFKDPTLGVSEKEQARGEQSKSKAPPEDLIHSDHSYGSASAGSKSLSPEVTREMEERFAEAEFYFQQGLKEEAKQLYQKVLSLKPSHFQAQARLAKMELEESLSHPAAPPPKKESEPAKPQAQKTAPPTQEEAEPAPQAQKMATPAQEEGDVNLSEMFMDELGDKSEPAGTPESAVAEAIDPAQKELESLFREFKKGVQEQFGDQDYETRYNLGIAYKEMGLIKEAIEEFKLASKGQNLFIAAISMIAACYKEEGDYEHAVQQFQAALGDERCTSSHAIGLKYELAQLYELTDREKEALELLTEIYEADKSFKDVAQKIKALKSSGPAVAKKEAAVQTTATVTTKQTYAPKAKSDKKKKVSYL